MQRAVNQGFPEMSDRQEEEVRAANSFEAIGLAESTAKYVPLDLGLRSRLYVVS